MPDPIPYEEKSRWFSELLQAQEEIAARHSAAMVGRKERVLVEEMNPKTGLLSGRTDGSVIVEFPGEVSLIGQFVQVEVTAARNWILRGEQIPSEE